MAEITTKFKQDLKDVFAGVSKVFHQAAVVDLSSGNAIEIKPEYELPVAVESLKMSQDAPQVNHYKVVGLNGDWVTTSTAGDTSVEMIIPTKDTDVLKLVYGNDAVKSITANVTIANEATAVSYNGSSLQLKAKKITGTFILVNEAEDQLMIISGAELFATPKFDNTGTEPFAIQLTGAISNTDKPSFAWLKKVVV